jgi:outer membrane protein assembly factor BamE (lipoprotein component of BamABCDE complex)
LREVDGRFVDGLAAFLLAFVVMSCSAVQCAAQRAPADGLDIFKAWLDRAHPGYARDEGPARFRNPTVDAAYAGRRFYYVLAHTRGMRPRLPNELSVVAHVDDNGNVTPLNSSSPATYRPGLRKVSTAKGARQAAAAVLILAMGDPVERRWRFLESMLTVKKDKTGWVCTYGHGDEYHTSQVSFDKNGVLSAIRSNPPPVP